MERSACSPSRILLALLFASATASYARAEGKILPSFSEVRSGYSPSDGKLLDREGELLQEQRLQHRGRTLDWVPLAELSPSLQAAILLVEDRRFFEHSGVDLRALAGALWQNLTRHTRRGASTLTMQTVNLLEDSGIRRRKSVWGKVRQGRLAWELEREWSKEQIFEAYVNLVSFRGEYRGVRAASRALFAREPHGLDLRESFLLAALLRAPGMSAAKAGDRLCAYIPQQPSLGSCEDLRQFARLSLRAKPSSLQRVSLAPHLARRLLSEKTPELRSTLDAAIQRQALASVQDQIHLLRSQNARDAAVIVVNNHSGEVLAYVGGSGAFSAAAEVDMAQSQRQAGSTLKPFLYGLGFEKGVITPDSWLLDEPFELGLDRGSYEPDNYDHKFHGPVPAKVALASSLNIPAVRLADLLGVDSFQGLLGNLGFRDLRVAEHYGASLALGTADVTLFDLVQAYMAIANEGVWKPLRFSRSDPPGKSRRVFSRQTGQELAAILSDRGYRALTFGWDSLLATSYPAAVKTGTSKDMRDNWCLGFSRDYTVGVWVGNSGGEPMWQVSGISGAAPIWRSLMDHLHQGRATKPFLALRVEEPAFERGQFGRILYPAAGAILAVDPDIPPLRQRIPLEAEGAGSLFLDGALLSDRDWVPQKGRHRLSLRGQHGEVLDDLAFEVR